MATFQDLLNAIAQVVGGTQPDPNRPNWFSGNDVGDGSGVTGLKGCYATPPAAVEDYPVAVVFPGPFRVPQLVLTQGLEENEDQIRVQVFVARVSPDVDYSVLNPYRDSVPAAFRSHMQLLATISVIEAPAVGGRPGVLKYAGNPYVGWDFTVRVRREEVVTYQA